MEREREKARERERERERERGKMYYKLFPLVIFVESIVKISTIICIL